MTAARGLGLAIALAACGGSVDRDLDPAGAPPPRDPVDRLVRAAEAAGWVVQEGAYASSTMEYCCDAGANCLGNNPSTPYGLVALPPAPGQAEPDHDAFWMWGPVDPPGLSRSFRMRADEAVLLVGEAPPESAYFSLRSSVATREMGASGYHGLLLGSLGPTTNHLTLQAERGAPWWGAPFAVITSADHTVEDAVAGWLREVGFAAGDVHRDRIAAPDVRFGLGRLDDTLMIAARIAVPSQPEALDAWEARPPLRALRLTPPDGFAWQPMDREPLLPLGSGQSEDAWREAVDALGLAIRARFPDREGIREPVTAGFTETFSCMEDFSCVGEVRDRYAARVPTATLPEGEHLVIYGVNHARTGRASYHNASIMVDDHWVGVASIDSDAMVGSARAYLGHDEPLVDDLYAWVISRDCSAFTEPCLQVERGCPWPDLDETFWVTWRMYLDPVSGVAPAGWELVEDRMLRFPAP